MVKTREYSPAQIAEAQAKRGPELRVICEGEVRIVPLPRSGELVIGRAPEAHIQVNHPSISRKHAILHVGKTMQIEDLGSMNGTTLRDGNLAANARSEVFPDEVIGVGAAMLIIQKDRQGSQQARRICTHDYFELRLEDEVARADRSDGKFVVARFQIPSPAHIERGRNIICAALRPADLIATYTPNEFEVLLVDCPQTMGLEIIRRVVFQMQETGIAPKYGAAAFPQDARNPNQLIAMAGRAALDEPSLGGTSDVIIKDASMERIHRLIQQVSSSNLSVLLLGETGVGKQVLAEEVHRCSPRGDKKLMQFNCAALQETLLESELFGHEAGSFTGATKRKTGLLESANGGTVFLDEIAEMPVSTQVKLLTAIEVGEVLPVGGVETRKIDVRFVAATNRDIEAEVERGTFRQDLYYRLNGVAINIPPLRERENEILPLANSFNQRMSKQLGRLPPLLSEDAKQLLLQYSWPGNIRELRNIIERAVVLSDDQILPSHLPTEKMSSAIIDPARRTVSGPIDIAKLPLTSSTAGKNPTVRLPSSTVAEFRESAGLQDELSDIEKQRIAEALEVCAGNQSKAAKMLGMSRSTLIRRLDDYGIKRPRKPR